MHTTTKIKIIIFFQYVNIATLAILIFIDLVIRNEQMMITLILHLITAFAIIVMIGMFDNIKRELNLPNVNAITIPNVNPISISVEPSAPLIIEC